MKRTTILSFVLLCSLAIDAQSAFRFLDEETKQPICGIYPKILRDKHYFENCGGTDENGIFKIEIGNKNTASTYYLHCGHKKYAPIWTEIELNKQDTTSIFLKKSPYYFEKTDSMFVQLCSYMSSTSGYEPMQLYSLNDFPDFIKEKTLNYIKNRVGDKYVDKFFLVRGEIRDLDIINKGLKGRNRYTSKYNLCIGFRNEEKGIAVYSSQITFNESGNMQKGLLFPVVHKGALQENLVSFEKVKSLAKERNFYKIGQTKIEMGYYSKPNILVWKFINRTYNKNNTFTEETLIFNAHNGKFIKKNIYEGYWIE